MSWSKISADGSLAVQEFLDKPRNTIGHFLFRFDFLFRRKIEKLPKFLKHDHLGSANLVYNYYKVVECH